MSKIINGNEIRHLQFSEFSQGHGSIYGILNNEKKFKLHITEIFKMLDEFEFSIGPGSGKTLDHTLMINWNATNKLRKKKDFTFKSDSAQYKKDGNWPNEVNCVSKTGKGEDTEFIRYRTGPYTSGNLVITDSLTNWLEEGLKIIKDVKL